MAGPRTIVAAALIDELAATDPPAGIVVIDHPRTIDHITAPTLLLASATVEPSPVPLAWLTWTLDAVLLIPRSEPGPGDDEADHALLDLIAAVDAATPAVVLTRAERITVDEWPAWGITLTATFSKEIS